MSPNILLAEVIEVEELRAVLSSSLQTLECGRTLLSAIIIGGLSCVLETRLCPSCCCLSK